ncbi:HNH endonuclease [Streptomyces coelicoflavus]|uniref:HNH endonuclease n=1 Tax=Streptomyces coelicoflavus TaxID=285562 RepID=UPI002254C783|nr:HNH endonuclease [Streptomyces coelicoflavus]MCX5035337.1 HNH endonuclease [Streptomyces coelicoflavus]
MKLYKERGRSAFLHDHGFSAASQYYVQFEGALYDAKAVTNVAYRRQHGPVVDRVISGGQAHSNRLLEQLGFTVVDGRPTTVEGELAWRLALWQHLTATEDLQQVPPQALRDYDVYGGGQGIWLDASRTRRVHEGGITVAVLHTGAHYPDDLGEESVLYHYPRTNRQAGRDASEIAATKVAAQLRLPVFVIAKPAPRSAVRIVRLAWVEGWEDESEQFLISYGGEAPTQVLGRDQSDQEPFELEGNRRRIRQRNVQVRPDQARFKLRVFQRYGPRCPLTGIAVPQMIEAAHLRPVEDDGTDDPRNGLPLSAGLHRAFDAGLFAIHPDSLEVVTRSGGPTVRDLHIAVPHLRDLDRKPHREALAWRFERWLARSGPRREIQRQA